MRANPLKIGPRTPPGIQTDPFFELRPAVATRGSPEGQKPAHQRPPRRKVTPTRRRTIVVVGPELPVPRAVEHQARDTPAPPTGAAPEPLGSSAAAGRARWLSRGPADLSCAGEQTKKIRFRFFAVFGLRGPFPGPGAAGNRPRMKNRVGWTPGGVRGPILSGFPSRARRGGRRGR